MTATDEQTTHPASDLGWSLGVLLRAYEHAMTSAVEAVPHGFRGFLVLREVVRGQRRVHPTAGAEALLAELEHRMAVAEDAVFGALDPAERTAVGQLLRRAACGYRETGDPCTTVEHALGR